SSTDRTSVGDFFIRKEKWIMNTNQAFTLQVEKRSIRTQLKKLSARKNLEFEEMAEAMEIILNDAVSDSEVAAFLMALKAKGETVEEIAALVGVLRENALPIRRTMTNVMDNCGTGGDGSHNLDCSTTAALFLAEFHGTVNNQCNKHVTNRTGSSNRLTVLGLVLVFSPDDTYKLLQENNVAFLYAPNLHPMPGQIFKFDQF